MLTQKYYFCKWYLQNSVQLLAKVIHDYLMITLKLERSFVLFVTSKTQTERFVEKWQFDNFGALFC